jgi:hypothetical protein
VPHEKSLLAATTSRKYVVLAIAVALLIADKSTLSITPSAFCMTLQAVMSSCVGVVPFLVHKPPFITSPYPPVKASINVALSSGKSPAMIWSAVFPFSVAASPDILICTLPK